MDGMKNANNQIETYESYDTYITFNARTGEIVDTVFSEQIRNNLCPKFLFINPELLSVAVSGLGKGQYEFVLYLMTQRSRDGYVYGLLSDLSANSSLSANTVLSAMKHLEQIDFIRRVNRRCWMLNPKVLFSTRMSRQARLYAMFCSNNNNELSSEKNISNIIHEIASKDKRYLKVFPEEFKSRTAGLGHQQIRFLMYLLCEVDDKCHIYGSREELAKQAKVSRETVRATLQVFREKDFLRRVSKGCLMLNPSVVADDRNHNRKQLAAIYNTL